MNVLLTLVAANSGLSGVQRHALNLASCLLDRDDIDVHVAIAPWQRELVLHYGLNHPRFHLHVGRLSANLLGRNTWFYSDLPRLASEINADVVHASYPIPVKRTGIAVPLIVTLHDLYPFEVPKNFGILKAALHRSVVRQCVAAADAITCVSHATANSAQRYLPANVHAKISVIYNCVTRSHTRPSAPNSIEGRGPFLLSIAQHRYNKNILLLIRVFHQLLLAGYVSSEAFLVIVGMRGPETAKIERLIKTASLSDRVVLLEGISEGELQWCYQHCSAVVVPSAAEGFCLPVAEAILFGCRLICSDLAVLREIAGDRCKYVPLGLGSDLRFIEAISDSLRLQPPAPTELPQFSRQTIADQYVSLYRRLVSTSAELELASGGEVTIPDSGHARV
jgi:glycosyltransferase involved in cell wall biosynthesis